MNTQDFDTVRSLMSKLDRAHGITHDLAITCEKDHPEEMNVIRGLIDGAMWLVDAIIEEEIEWAEESRASARRYARLHA